MGGGPPLGPPSPPSPRLDSDLLSFLKDPDSSWSDSSMDDGSPKVDNPPVLAGVNDPETAETLLANAASAQTRKPLRRQSKDLPQRIASYEANRGRPSPVAQITNTRDLTLNPSIAVRSPPSKQPAVQAPPATSSSTVFQIGDIVRCRKEINCGSCTVKVGEIGKVVTDDNAKVKVDWLPLRGNRRTRSRKWKIEAAQNISEEEMRLVRSDEGRKRVNLTEARQKKFRECVLFKRDLEDLKNGKNSLSPQSLWKIAPNAIYRKRLADVFREMNGDALPVVIRQDGKTKDDIVIMPVPEGYPIEDLPLLISKGVRNADGTNIDAKEVVFRIENVLDESNMPGESRSTLGWFYNHYVKTTQLGDQYDDGWIHVTWFLKSEGTATE